MRDHIEQTSWADTFCNWPPEPACLGCGHYRPLRGDHDGRNTGMACHYLLDTGRRRGCPFGPGCHHHPAASV